MVVRVYELNEQDLSVGEHQMDWFQHGMVIAHKTENVDGKQSMHH